VVCDGGQNSLAAVPAALRPGREDGRPSGDEQNVNKPGCVGRPVCANCRQNRTHCGLTHRGGAMTMREHFTASLPGLVESHGRSGQCGKQVLHFR
jgi:hypothetical protein